MRRTLLATTTTLAYTTAYTYSYAVINISIALPVTRFKDLETPGVLVGLLRENITACLFINAARTPLLEPDQLYSTLLTSGPP